jgi:hypothetical protein
MKRLSKFLSLLLAPSPGALPHSVDAEGYANLHEGHADPAWAAQLPLGQPCRRDPSSLPRSSHASRLPGAVSARCTATRRSARPRAVVPPPCSITGPRLTLEPSCRKAPPDRALLCPACRNRRRRTAARTACPTRAEHPAHRRCRCPRTQGAHFINRQERFT